MAERLAVLQAIKAKYPLSTRSHPSGPTLIPMGTNPTFGNKAMAIHYTSGERDTAKAFLEANGAVRTDVGSERYARWVTVDGNVWVEYDDPPFYTLFIELPEPAWDA